MVVITGSIVKAGLPPVAVYNTLKWHQAQKFWFYLYGAFQEMHEVQDKFTSLFFHLSIRHYKDLFFFKRWMLLEKEQPSWVIGNKEGCVQIGEKKNGHFAPIADTRIQMGTKVDHSNCTSHKKVIFRRLSLKISVLIPWNQLQILFSLVILQGMRNLWKDKHVLLYTILLLIGKKISVLMLHYW